MVELIKSAIKLTKVKFRLSFLVAISAVFGAFIVNKNALIIHYLAAFTSVFCLAMGAGILNQIQEIKLDGLFHRTQKRPLPAHTVTIEHAWITTLFYLAIGFAIIAVLTMNQINLLYGILSIVIYNFVYTPLKTKTSLAVLPGAISGALPLVIGGYFVANSIWHTDFTLAIMLILIWQTPHFWLVMMHYKKDFALPNSPVKSLLAIFPEFSIKRMIYIWLFSFGLVALALSFSPSFTNLARYFIWSQVYIFLLTAFYLLFISFSTKKYKYIFMHVNILVLMFMIIIIF